MDMRFPSFPVGEPAKAPGELGCPLIYPFFVGLAPPTGVLSITVELVFCTMSVSASGKVKGQMYYLPGLASAFASVIFAFG